MLSGLVYQRGIMKGLYVTVSKELLIPQKVSMAIEF